ncbi:MAG: DUF5680 domain-containing protein [Spirochaetes bacterium]|nr:DUF5680 domain-containing protein [Spirochaetota bacterium]
MEDRFIKFLTEAKRQTYASGENGVKEILPDGAMIMRYGCNPLTYVDRFFGGEPYIGEEILFNEDQAIWGMNFTGRLIGAGIDMRDRVYGFLQEALREKLVDAPTRGPEKHTRAGYTYKTHMQGTMEFFNGYEEILFGTDVVYNGYYHGGTINKII